MNQRIIEAKFGKRTFFLLICYLCFAALSMEAQKPESGVALISDAKTGTILVRAELNQRPVTMILDTGASHSMFDARAFGLSPQQLQMARMKSRGLGLDADVVWQTADFQIADLQWDQKPIEIADLSTLSKIYKRTIDGILGQDVLRAFSSVRINYSGGCVMLQR
jgi:hypothetical protein